MHLLKLLCFGWAISALAACLTPTVGFAHVGAQHEHAPATYYLHGQCVKGHFLMGRNDSVFIQQPNGHILSAPLQAFSFGTQRNLSHKIAQLKRINHQKVSEPRAPSPAGLAFGGLLLVCLVLYFTRGKARLNSVGLLTRTGGILLVFYACQTDNTTPNSPTTSPQKTDPASIEKVFAPFRNTVKTRFDDTYFYVESDGMPPQHNMMVGITSWQQQVPIPQNYTGSNAWSIPLKPELADKPLSLRANFMKGAVAIAPNGIPIFNPLNNRGEDAFAIGELDQWGGHCGRADDYHYHIAPLHFEGNAGNNPIAMALDGFAIYGSKEPDGSPMQPLDENHGHLHNGTYHYHAKTTYPYFMAAMRGKVTLDPSTSAPENQILPQARATGVRPALTALRDAVITDFANIGPNAYSLQYSLSGQKAYVNYSWDNVGNFTFNFVGIDGKTTTSKYVRK